MRLEDDMDAPVTAFTGGGQGSANLGGMVAVVVDHRDAARRAAQLKAPVHAAKVAEAHGDLAAGNSKLVGNGDGGRGIEHVVMSRDIQLKWTESAVRREHTETRKTPMIPWPFFPSRVNVSR